MSICWRAVFSYIRSQGERSLPPHFKSRDSESSKCVLEFSDLKRSPTEWEACSFHAWEQSEERLGWEQVVFILTEGMRKGMRFLDPNMTPTKRSWFVSSLRDFLPINISWKDQGAARRLKIEGTQRPKWEAPRTPPEMPCEGEPGAPSCSGDSNPGGDCICCTIASPLLSHCLPAISFHPASSHPKGPNCYKGRSKL